MFIYIHVWKIHCIYLYILYHTIARLGRTCLSCIWNGCMRANVHTNKHKYIHACIHTNLQSNMHTYKQTSKTSIHTYIHTYIHACINTHTCIHAYMHTCIHACMHACIHAYMNTHTNIQASIHTYVRQYNQHAGKITKKRWGLPKHMMEHIRLYEGRRHVAWHKMTRDGTKWHEMARDDTRWHEMIQDSRLSRWWNGMHACMYLCKIQGNLVNETVSFVDALTNIERRATFASMYVSMYASMYLCVPVTPPLALQWPLTCGEAWDWRDMTWFKLPDCLVDETVSLVDAYESTSTNIHA